MLPQALICDMQSDSIIGKLLSIMVAAAKPHADMPNKPEVRLVHCSVGCNQVAECLDWGAHGLVAYGAHNQAIVYDPQVVATPIMYVILQPL